MNKMKALLPKIFLIVALPMVLFFAFAVPPFQVPDEYTHLLRADQISYGEIIGTRLDDKNSGGYVETSYRLLYLVFQTQDGASKDLLKTASNIPLTGQREFLNFPNTVQYGPFLYIPQAAALGLARTTGMNALQAFYLARCFNGFVALAIGFLALQFAHRGRFLFYCLLSMPMPIFLMGSISQDALLLTGSALFLSIASKCVSTNRTPNVVTYLGLIALLVALTWGRLPCAVLGVVFLLKPFADAQWKDKTFLRWPGLAAIACVIALTGLWIEIISNLQISLRPSVSAHDQTSFLLEHISLIPKIAANSLNGPNFLFTAGGLFGSLGVFNSKLPMFFYPIAFIGMISAFALETTQASILKPAARTIIALALLSGIGAVYLALYLTWTPVGQLSVEGVQGRYLIPFILGFAFTLPTAAPRIQKLLRPLVFLLPIVTITGVIVSVQKIISRYY